MAMKMNRLVVPFLILATCIEAPEPAAVAARQYESAADCGTTYRASALLADVTGDGADDLLCFYTDVYRRFRVVPSNGDGTFDVPTTVTFGPGPSGWLAASDLDGDT